jgi:hypothetical protein
MDATHRLRTPALLDELTTKLAGTSALDTIDGRIQVRQSGGAT